MALLKAKPNEIPKDAVLLTEEEALKHQMEIVQKWPKTSEVFALKYGPLILGGAALLSGVFFNYHFRHKFMLGHLGRMSTYLPICVVPSFLTTLSHTEFVLKNVVLMKFDQCPVCLESRAAAFQAFIGTLYPLIMAPIGCSVLAVRYLTYDIPYLNEDPKKVFNIYKKMFSKIQTKSMYLFIGQAFLASVITHFEAKNVFTINEQLRKKEERLLWD